MSDTPKKLSMKGLKHMHKSACLVTRKETVTIAGPDGQALQTEVKHRTLKMSLKAWAKKNREALNLDDRPRSAKVKWLLAP